MNLQSQYTLYFSNQEITTTLFLNPSTAEKETLFRDSLFEKYFFTTQSCIDKKFHFIIPTHSYLDQYSDFPHTRPISELCTNCDSNDGDYGIYGITESDFEEPLDILDTQLYTICSNCLENIRKTVVAHTQEESQLIRFEL